MGNLLELNDLGIILLISRIWFHKLQHTSNQPLSKQAPIRVSNFHMLNIKVFVLLQAFCNRFKVSLVVSWML